MPSAKCENCAIYLIFCLIIGVESLRILSLAEQGGQFNNKGMGTGFYGDDNSIIYVICIIDINCG